MDPRLLQAYNDELVHLRETAKRFGEDYPSVAGRLGLGAAAQVDPHVERLLEGVAFLGARVQLKLQDQFPDFTQHLLSAIQPHYLAPTPSICIVGFEPHEGDAALAQGIEIERGTRLQAVAADRDATPVTFQTGHAVTLWPLRVEAVEYLPSRSAVAPYLASLQSGAAVEAGLRIRLRTTGGARLGALSLTALPLYHDGEGGGGRTLSPACRGCGGGCGHRRIRERRRASAPAGAAWFQRRLRAAARRAALEPWLSHPQRIFRLPPALPVRPAGGLDKACKALAERRPATS
jgi:type VI protein secretion system component VasA